MYVQMAGPKAPNFDLSKFVAKTVYAYVSRTRTHIERLFTRDGGGGKVRLYLISYYNERQLYNYVTPNDFPLTLSLMNLLLVFSTRMVRLKKIFTIRKNISLI